jgi:hypothetical protein
MIGFVDEIESGERMGMGPMGQGNLVPPPLLSLSACAKEDGSLLFSGMPLREQSE